MFLLSHLSTRLGRSRMRKDLLKLDGRLLADIGYSRELLEEGVRAFPWRTPAEPAKGFGRIDPALLKPRAKLPEAELDEAVAALAIYSDDELRDLELTRDGLEHAVRHGRPGYPEAERHAA